MPIITVTEAKTLNQISVSTYDTLIGILLPIVEETIIDYCNNHFIDTYQDVNGIMPSVYTYSNTISFLSSDNSINDTETLDLSDKNFKSGDDIRVYNSLHNDGFYTINTITADKITLDTINDIADEDNDNTIVIARVKYPKSLMLTAARMIKFDLRKNGIDFKSEKLDDYSYTRDSLVNGYPVDILSALNDYRSMILKTIPYNILYIRQE